MSLKNTLFLLLLAATAGSNRVARAQAAAENPAPAKASASVLVQGPNGAPVPGATVAVMPYNGPFRRLTADGNGRAATELVPRYEPTALGRVVVLAPGYGFNSGLLRAGENIFSLLPESVRTVKIVDAGGQPVAGVKAEVLGGTAPGKEMRGIWLGALDEPLVSAPSDAQGHLTVPGMPAGYTIRATFRDPRYVTAIAELADGVEGLVKLRPGATLRGRLLTATGEGLAGVRIMAQSVMSGRDGWATGETDAQGNYVLTGLPSGQFNVMADFKDKPLVAAAAEKVGTTEGQETQVPPLTATAGILLTGTVKNKKTGAPVAEVGIGLYGPNRPRSTAVVTPIYTDANGHYQLRVVPGPNYIYLMDSPEGYLRQEQTGRDLTVDANTKPIDFELDPAIRLRGVVVDEAGKPTVANLEAKVKWERFGFSSDAEGKFEVVLQQDGQVSFLGGEVRDGKFWEVVSPKIVQTPFEEPVRVVVKSVPTRSLSGRAVTPAGEPVPGVKVEVQASIPDGTGGLDINFTTVESNAEGRFELKDVRPEVTLTLKAERDGFALVQGGEVKLVGLVWQASDLVLEPLNGRVAGRILDAAGQPVTGAKVTAAGQNSVSKADGGFELTGLPAGPVLVVAQRDREVGTVTSGAEPVELRLAPAKLQPTDLKLAAAIYDELLVSGQGKGKGALAMVLAHRSLLGRNFDQHFEALASRPGGTADWELGGLAMTVLADDKTDKAISSDRLRRIVGAISRPQLRLNILLQISLKGQDPALREDAWQTAKGLNAGLDKAPAADDEMWARMSTLWPMAVVVEREEGTEAGFKVLDSAMALVLKRYPEKAGAKDEDGTETQGNFLQMAAEIVAQGSPELLRRLLTQIDPESGYYVQALGQAIPVVAKHHGYEAAKPLLDELQKLPEPKTDAGNALNRRPGYAFIEAVRQSIPYFGAQSPQEALALARRMPEARGDGDRWGGERVSALAVAARYLPAAQAAPLWREVIQDAGSAPRYAAWAYAQDPALGREMFAAARALLPDLDEKDTYDKYRNTAAFAFYLAIDNPAESRLILEQTWAHAASHKDADGMLEVARAMARLDATRAMEMTKAVPEDKYSRSLLAQSSVACWVGTDDAVRSNWPFDRNDASDFWRDGGEMW